MAVLKPSKLAVTNPYRSRTITAHFDTWIEVLPTTNQENLFVCRDSVCILNGLL